VLIPLDTVADEGVLVSEGAVSVPTTDEVVL
jgi:hypothetical protein